MTAMALPTNHKAVARAVEACVANAKRLLSDAQMVEFESPNSTRLYLILIAQEELAKAFMLILVSIGVFPLSKPILRAMNDHTCKQLVGMVMDYMIMHWDEMDDLKRMIEDDASMADDEFPIDIASALTLLRYEKVARWETKRVFYEYEPEPSRAARDIARGEHDRRKQDALYVRVNPDSSIASVPHSTPDAEIYEEAERASRYRYFVQDMIDGSATGRRYDKTMTALRILFSQHPPV